MESLVDLAAGHSARAAWSTRRWLYGRALEYLAGYMCLVSLTCKMPTTLVIYEQSAVPAQIAAGPRTSHSPCTPILILS